MLTQCEEGYRNAVCGFLIKYFKQYYKLSREDIYSVLSRWADEVCEPPFDLDECFDRFYNAGGLNYDAELAAKYGIIDFTQIRDRSIIWIPNEFCNNFDTLSAQAVKMYLAIKQLEHYKKPTTLESIMEVLDISHEATARKTVKELISQKFAYVVNGNKKTGEPNTYFTQKIISITQGQTRFSYNDIAAYVKDLNGTEIKLYMYMKYKCFRTGGCFMAQKTLGDATDLKQHSVSGIMKRLEEKSYVEIEKSIINEFISYCNYTLLR
jgi:DNA-binding MarR family transcriptional regulator